MLDAKQKRRDQLSIISNILESARGGSLKTKIMHTANLSFVQLNDYLTFMVDNGLIRQTTLNGRENYIATIKGVLFAQMYRELLSMITTQQTEESPLVTELFQ
ncbi:MAG TPA: winged helix-turn-helix domain-containing protein [Candidatus Acidoferrales bacterium]|nr:winged helix-turn-helix domain-containing protein [Candidatus Acidoferrales bacterium]